MEGQKGTFPPEILKAYRKLRRQIVIRKRKQRDKYIKAITSILDVLAFYLIWALMFLAYCLQAGPIW